MRRLYRERCRTDDSPRCNIRSRLCRRHAADSRNRIESNFRKRQLDRLRKFASNGRRHRFVKQTQVRVKIVVRRILCCAANRVLKSPQFCARRELHKQCFDEFAGLMDLECVERDRCAMSPDAREHFLRRLGMIRADKDGHVRLEHRRIMPSREITN